MKLRKEDLVTREEGYLTGRWGPGGRKREGERVGGMTVPLL